MTEQNHQAFMEGMREVETHFTSLHGEVEARAVRETKLTDDLQKKDAELQETNEASETRHQERMAFLQKLLVLARQFEEKHKKKDKS